ncbi:hypothetical protein GCM10009771_08920 [Nesterenkonia flava]
MLSDCPPAGGITCRVVSLARLSAGPCAGCCAHGSGQCGGAGEDHRDIQQPGGRVNVVIQHSFRDYQQGDHACSSGARQQDHQQSVLVETATSERQQGGEEVDEQHDEDHGQHHCYHLVHGPLPPDQCLDCALPSGTNLSSPAENSRHMTTRDAGCCGPIRGTQTI